MSNPIQIEESFFTLPEHPLTTDFQRSIGMAIGTIVSKEGKQGVIEIDGHRYLFKEDRQNRARKSRPLVEGQQYGITFWPTTTPRAIKFQAGFYLKICNIRKDTPYPGMVEVVGRIKSKENGMVLFSIKSQTQKKEYLTFMQGETDLPEGVLVQATGRLINGGVHLLITREIKPS